MGWMLLSTPTSWVLALVMGRVLSGTLTPLGVSPCDGSGCCEGERNKRDLTGKVEANILLSNELGVSAFNGMGAAEYPNPIGCEPL